MRRPIWCHHCGCYSFADEWGTSGLGVEGDTCPVCGDAWPVHDFGPLLEREGVAGCQAAAYERREVWS